MGQSHASCQKLIIGSRGSALALAQANIVKKELTQVWGSKFSFEIKIIKTTGDVLQKGSIAKLPKGLFTKEIEVELRQKKIDMAVHSCKDLPTEISEEFCIAAVLKRASARDMLILKHGLKKENLPQGAVILTSSPRRQAQWLAMCSHTRTESIRGNIETRIRKLLENKNWSGLIMAEAGIIRGCPPLEGVSVEPLSFDEMLPAPGQGALVVETRNDDAKMREIISKINDAVSEKQILAEREFLRAMGGGCRSSIAAYAEPLGKEKLKLSGVVFNQDGAHHDFLLGKEPEKLGRELAEKLKKFL